MFTTFLYQFVTHINVFVDAPKLEVWYLWVIVARCYFVKCLDFDQSLKLLHNKMGLFCM